MSEAALPQGHRTEPACVIYHERMLAREGTSIGLRLQILAWMTNLCRGYSPAHARGHRGRRAGRRRRGGSFQQRVPAQS
jgi:hypothetical protein